MHFSIFSRLCASVLTAICATALTPSIAAITFGTISGGLSTQRLCSGNAPSAITFGTVPAGAASFTYQWFQQNGELPAPTGSSEAGWQSTLSGASYRPPLGVNTTRTIACMVTASTGQKGWATGARVLVFYPSFRPGSLASGNQTLVSPANPAPISFLSVPIGSASFTYQWMQKDGIVAAPTDPNDNTWTSILVSPAASYDPPAGLLASRSYACFVRSGNPACGSATWAMGVRQITVSPAPAIVSLGKLKAGNQTLCNPADPAPVEFTAPPTGAASFSYQWYSAAGSVAAPIGSSLAGWTPIAGANSPGFDPSAGLTVTTTFACFVTPSNGAAGWAAGARVATVLSAFSAAAVSNNAQTLAAPADPRMISFNHLATGSMAFAYTWYYQDGVVPAPVGNSTAGWTLIGPPNGNDNSYDPPAGLATTRTYACLVSPGGSPTCGNPSWALGSSRVTVQ